MDRLTPTRRPAQPVVMRQVWEKLLFLHWPVCPETVQPLLPPGLTVDTFEGMAYIGLVPFTMRDVRPVGAPRVQGLSDFHETNVRTYVHRQGRDPGVWFFSLDAANPIAVALARSLWKLPYYFARMELQVTENQVTYSSERVAPGPVRAAWGGPIGCSIRATPLGQPQPAPPDSLLFFLAERYLLYSFAQGRLFQGRVYHTPYPLQSATLPEFSDSLVAAAGIELPDRDCPPLVHFSSGVRVEIFPLRPCRPRHP